MSSVSIREESGFESLTARLMTKQKGETQERADMIATLSICFILPLALTILADLMRLSLYYGGRLCHIQIIDGKSFSLVDPIRDILLRVRQGLRQITENEPRASDANKRPSAPEGPKDVNAPGAEEVLNASIDPGDESGNGYVSEAETVVDAKRFFGPKSSRDSLNPNKDLSRVWEWKSLWNSGEKALAEAKSFEAFSKEWERQNDSIRSLLKDQNEEIIAKKLCEYKSSISKDLDVAFARLLSSIVMEETSKKNPNLEAIRKRIQPMLQQGFVQNILDDRKKGRWETLYGLTLQKGSQAG